jgi:predicted membrane protein (TIGR00267 family)
LVNVLGVVLGGTAAGAGPRIVIATALAATFAESISMGAVAYTSRLAERDHYLSERQRELREIREVPDQERQDVLRTSVTVTIASIIGSLVPLLPYFLVAAPTAVWLSVATSATALFGIGAYKAVSLVGDWRRSGVEMVIIGLGAALAGFVVGRLFGVSG